MKCALCSRTAVKEFFPFCSKTCQQQDLLCWMQGHYYIPGNEHAVNLNAPDEEENDE